MKELIKIQDELDVPKDQFNSFGNYYYRNAEDILQAVKPLLKINNCLLTISDEVVVIGDRYYIKATATITNSEGIAISSTALARESAVKKGMDESQITGATSSYARKYALNGLFAIDDAKDADNDKKGSDGPRASEQSPKGKSYSRTPSYASAAQVKLLEDLLKKAKLDPAAVYAKRGIKDIKKLTSSDLNKMITAMKSFADKKEGKDEK